MRLIYSSHYDIGPPGLDRLHPFDTRKYSRAWKVLRRQFGSTLKEHTIKVPRPVSERELLAVHEPDYLAQLRDSTYLARALEVPILRHVPARLLDWLVLRPMRYATMGTLLAAEQALQSGLAVNLSGGYHHAEPAAAGGFCIYSDIALAVHHLRTMG
jgi:histone deacetylase 11